MKYIVFDFNGTILDDAEVGMMAENECIARYLKRPPLTLDEYLHVFSFPIKDYYEKIGFDFNAGYTYEEVGKVWFDSYWKFRDHYKIHDGVIETLEKSHTLGYKNILLSASDIGVLKEQLKELKIEQYFDEVIGTNSIYGESKVGLAKKWIEGKNPDECIFIGDSLHDLESANAMGIKNCYLVSKGHQAKDILVKEYDKVVDDIREVKICV